MSVVLAESPTVVAEHAFTTGKIKRSSIEKVLPNTQVEFAIKDGREARWISKTSHGAGCVRESLRASPGPIREERADVDDAVARGLRT